MSKVHKSSFKKLQEMPSRFEVFELNWHLDAKDLEKVKNGYASWGMDEKWDAYHENGKLYLHRSWTGSCIYIADILDKTDGTGIISKVTVNRDKSQYNYSDIESDKDIFQRVVRFQLIDYEPPSREVDVFNTQFDNVRSTIPEFYLKGTFHYYRQSLDHLKIVWNGKTSQYIDLSLTRGIEATSQALATSTLDFANILTTTFQNKMVMVICDEEFQGTLGVIEFLKIPPLQKSW